MFSQNLDDHTGIIIFNDFFDQLLNDDETWIIVFVVCLTQRKFIDIEI